MSTTRLTNDIRDASAAAASVEEASIAKSKKEIIDQLNGYYSKIQNQSDDSDDIESPQITETSEPLIRDINNLRNEITNLPPASPPTEAMMSTLRAIKERANLLLVLGNAPAASPSIATASAVPPAPAQPAAAPVESAAAEPITTAESAPASTAIAASAAAPAAPSASPPDLSLTREGKPAALNSLTSDQEKTARAYFQNKHDRVNLLLIKLNDLAAKYNKENEPESKASILRELDNDIKILRMVTQNLINLHNIKPLKDEFSTLADSDPKKRFYLHAIQQGKHLLARLDDIKKHQAEIALHADAGKYYDTHDNARKELGNLIGQQNAVAALHGAEKNSIPIDNNKNFLARVAKLDLPVNAQTGTISHKTNGIFRTDIHMSEAAIQALVDVPDQTGKVHIPGKMLDVKASIPGHAVTDWAYKIVNQYYDDPRCDGTNKKLIINGNGLPKNCVAALILAALHKTNNPELIELRNCGDMKVTNISKAQQMLFNDWAAGWDADKKIATKPSAKSKFASDFLDQGVKQVDEEIKPKGPGSRAGGG